MIIVTGANGQLGRAVRAPDARWVPTPATGARGQTLPFAPAPNHADFAAVDSTLETLLGRRPQTVRDVLARVLKPAVA